MLEAQKGRVEFNDLDYEELKALVNFLYTKEVEDWNKVAYQLIFLADQYNIEQLKQMCEYHIGRNLTKRNVFKVLEATIEYEPIFSNQQIKKCCLSFINK